MARARKAKVFLTHRAVADLEEIESHTIGESGDAQAAECLDAFDRFFSCTKWNDDVLVLTIVHASRELLPHLDRLLPTLKSEVES